MCRITLLVIIHFLSLSVLGQAPIVWSEFFDEYPNGTEAGTGYNFMTNDAANAKWTSVYISSNRAAVNSGHYEVSGIGNNRLETENVDVSLFHNVSVEVQYTIRGNTATQLTLELDYFEAGIRNRMRINQVNGTGVGNPPTSGVLTTTLPNSYTAITCLLSLQTVSSTDRIQIHEIRIRGNYIGDEGTTVSNGMLNVRYFDGIAGDDVSDLTSSTPYRSHTISEVTTINSFSLLANRGNNYGAEITGFIIPPETGYYSFLMNANDKAQFRLSSNHQTTNLPTNSDAECFNATTAGVYFDNSTLNSRSIFLVKNEPYYVEVLYKEAVGNDHLSLSWIKPTSGNLEVIPMRAISTELLAPVNFSTTHQNVSCNGHSDAEIRVRVTGGRAPFRYRINGGTYQNSNHFTSLPQGTHSISVTDDTGRVITKTVNITQPNSLELTLAEEKSVCNTCDALGSVAITGGTEPYQLTWSDGVISSLSTFRYISFDAVDDISDYQLEITVPYSDGMATNFSDVRFTDMSGNTLPFWIESFEESVSANIWVRINTITTGRNRIMMHYAVPADPATGSNIDNVFDSGGLNVEYYFNENLTGTPTLCIDTNGINYAFADGDNVVIGDCGITNRGNVLSVRWTGWLRNPHTSSRVFMNTQSDDGFYLQLEDQVVFDHWRLTPPTFFHQEYTFTKPIVRFEYRFYEHYGNAYARVGSSATSTTGIGAIIPRDNYYYRNQVENPPTNITIGDEHRGLGIRRNLCEGDYTLVVNDANNCNVSQSVTIHKYQVNLSLNKTSVCAQNSNTVEASATITPVLGDITFEFLVDGVVHQRSNESTFDLPNNLATGARTVESNVEISHIHSPSACTKNEGTTLQVRTPIQTNRISFVP